MHQLFASKVHSVVQEIHAPIIDDAGVRLWIQREDLIHPTVSGNKFRKLKYNLLEAQRQGFTTVLTFGGAYSNHIAATAAAGQAIGLRTIGVIRGEELANDLANTLAQNPTLRFAQQCGMQFKFISRAAYKNKTTSEFLDHLVTEFGSFYSIPEGGTNALAVEGCTEILEPNNAYDVIACPVGTGGTIAGLITSSDTHQQVIGFPALKGDFLTTAIRPYVSKNNWYLETNYHFGGYGKINKVLIEFINSFYATHQIPLDPIYTGKMLYGLFDMIVKGVFQKNTRILAIHTGGLQGIAGMNQTIKKKGILPLINVGYES